MNVFPPLTGRLMYYASPHHPIWSERLTRRGAPMSDAPWHWLYKWMHLHAFHFPAPRVMGGANRAVVNGRWLTSAGAFRAFWSAARLTKSLNTVAEPRYPVRLESNCRRHKRGQQPEDCAIGCPATTVIICLCTSCLDSRRGVLTLLVWQTDVMGGKKNSPCCYSLLVIANLDVSLLLWFLDSGYFGAWYHAAWRKTKEWHLFKILRFYKDESLRAEPCFVLSPGKAALIIVPLQRELSRPILCLGVHQESISWHSHCSWAPIKCTF